MTPEPEPRVCAVCGTDISDKHPAAKTCGQNCRTTLHRRNKAAKVHEVDAAAKSAVAEIVQEQVREYVDREVLTEDLLHKIKGMVGLTQGAIDTLEAMLDSEDHEVAIRAAQTILRYTMGNPSVAPAPTEQAPSTVQVMFGLPRPGDPVVQPVIAGELAEEERTCGDCHKTKPASEFVGSSSRCQVCFDEIQEGVRAKLAPSDPTRPHDQPA
jgi:hypothetical protein